MTPIINPMWFYWIGVVDGLKGFLTDGVIIISILAVFGFGAYLFYLTSEYGYDEDDFNPRFAKFKKTVFRTFIPLIILIIVGLFIPSQTTLIQMMTASYATSDNIKAVTEAIQETADSIIDKLNEK